MTIKYKESWETKFRIKTLSELIDASAHADSGVAENANSRARVAIEFAEKTIELLYRKGLIDDEDVAGLVAGICNCDVDDIKIMEV